MSDTIYDRVYREMHKSRSPYCPYEKQQELRDLWEAEQQKFRDMVDAAVREGARDE